MKGSGKAVKRLLTPLHIFITLLFVISLVFATNPGSFIKHNYEVGEVSKQDIIANKTITYIDEIATADLELKTLSEIEGFYDRDPEVYKDIETKINEFYNGIILYKSELNKKESKKDDTKESKKEKEKPSDYIPDHFNLSEDTIKRVLNVNENTLASFLDYIKGSLRNQYDIGLTKEKLETFTETAKKDSNLYLFPEILRGEVLDSIFKTLKPNYILNKEESERKKEEALESIEPVYKKITKGEAVIRKYEEITDDHITKLEKLGLINEKFNINELLKLVPSIILYTLIFFLYCNRYLSTKLKDIRSFSLMLLTIFLTVFVTQLIRGTVWHFIPSISLLILFSLFWNRSFVLITAVFLGLLLNGEDLTFFVMIIIIGAALTTFKDKFQSFTDAIKNGLAIGLILSISTLILTYTIEHRILVEGHLELVLSGIFAGIIANGLIPLLENILGIATIYKLTELNKYDHPILEELYKKARGTYEHSRNVAHLVSVASNKIGTNTLLLKVAALYHDLGKMDKAEFFIENSTPEKNIHNQLDPYESAKVILEHPIKGVQLCKENKIPKEVIKLIESHHGDSTLYHFYNKAAEMGLEPKIEDFQYSTPAPITKEQSILMLADGTEAYSRSLNFSTIEELKSLISNFIYNKVKRGELRESELSAKEIEICIDEFTEAIFSFQHKRIEYNTGDRSNTSTDS